MKLGVLEERKDETIGPKQMDKFRYLLSLNEIYSGFDQQQDYHIYHLVDQLNLKFIVRKGDFITVLNDEGEKQIFSLSHMYNRRLIRPDQGLFKVEFLGPHNDVIRHDSSKKINDYADLKLTLEKYGFDGFYTLISVEELLLTLQKGAFLSSANKKGNDYLASKFLLQKTSHQDININYKDNINHFVRLHYRPKDDMLLAFHHAFNRTNKAKVLVQLDYDLIKDAKLKVYPLANCGLDLIYDQHFYQLHLNKDTFSVYHFEKYDFVAMFSAYDNHQHSTMVRTAEVLVFDRLPTQYIKCLYFESSDEENIFLRRLEEVDLKIDIPTKIDATKFD